MQNVVISDNGLKADQVASSPSDVQTAQTTSAPEPHGMMFPLLNTPFAELVLAPESTELLVIFSSRGLRNFQFSKLFQDLKINKLFLVDSTGYAWYLDGVKGLAGSAKELADNIRKIKAHHGFTKVTTFGSSMGGYAALVVGALADADLAIAPSPQTMFHENWPFSPETSSRAGDSAAIMRSSKTRFLIITSWDMLDVYHVSAVCTVPNISIYVTRSNHNVMGMLKSFASLEIIVSAALTDSNSLPDLLFTEQLNLHALTDQLKVFLDHFYNKRYAEGLPLIQQIVQVNPDWPDANRMLGTTYFHIKEFGSAHLFLLQAYNQDAFNTSTYPHLIAVLAEQNLYSKCAELLSEYTALLLLYKLSVPIALASVADTCYFAGAYSYAVNIRQNLNTQYGDNSCSNFYQLARALSANGKPNEAIAHYEKIVNQKQELEDKDLWMVGSAEKHIQALKSKLLVNLHT